ncbi:hypothetical protein [Alkalihalobacterium alkalinitrilicum]|uniref:hypothetical protein n=1 Tax=Alkalihalobacterium alkalinitrilicum TaxID=427920 RepID=UPI000994A328|nr:hypothetical protein [Alkalihalobacterium alkalinitrilicum]
MSGLIFAFFACAVLLLFSTGYTLLRTVERAQDNDERKKWRRYGLKMGVSSVFLFGVAIWLMIIYY